VDFEAIIDLKSVKSIKNISAGFFQETSAWILMPRYVEYWVSDDGHNFAKVATVNNSVPADDMTPLVQDLSAQIATNGRYVRIYARNYGKLPDWHTSAGCDAYIFIYEIVIK